MNAREIIENVLTRLRVLSKRVDDVAGQARAALDGVEGLARRTDAVELLARQAGKGGGCGCSETGEAMVSRPLVFDIDDNDVVERTFQAPYDCEVVAVIARSEHASGLDAFSMEWAPEGTGGSTFWSPEKNETVDTAPLASALFVDSLAQLAEKSREHLPLVGRRFRAGELIVFRAKNVNGAGAYEASLVFHVRPVA